MPHEIKSVGFILFVLMVLCVPIIIYGYSFSSIAFDKEWYENEFSNYNIYNNLKNYDIEKINNDVLDYLKFFQRKNFIENGFFNERERMHLLDVKILISKFLLVYYFSIIFFLLILMLVLLLNLNSKDIVKKMLKIVAFGSFLTLFGSFFFLLLSILDFDFLFGTFHKIFFAAGTFSFNPEFENIVVLYPEKLFFDLMAKIIKHAIFSSIIIFIFSSAFLLLFRKRIFFKNFF